MSTQIRAAQLPDLHAVTALVEQLNLEEGYEASASPKQLEEVLFDKRARVPMRALVYVLDKNIAGLILYYWGYDTVSASYGYHLADIVVEKMHRGKKIGTELFNALAEQCLRESGKWISLTVLQNNERAKDFYRRRGMVQVGVNFFAIGPSGLARCAQG